MRFIDLVTRTRSVRRFDGNHGIERATLEALVDVARLTASAANRQPLRYRLVCAAAENARVFPCLRWAGYLEDWNGPSPQERPTGYVIVLVDRKVGRSAAYDAGIAVQTMMRGAAERGLGGCIFGSVDRAGLREAVGVPEDLRILLVLALGKPAERVQIEPMPPDGSVRYWRGDTGVHHVPKRALNDIIIRE